MKRTLLALILCFSCGMVSAEFVVGSAAAIGENFRTYSGNRDFFVHIDHISAEPSISNGKPYSPFGLIQISALSVTDDVSILANEYIEYGAMSTNYYEDAFHIATAVAHQIPVLLSGNFRHMVRRKTRDVVNMVNTKRGFLHIEIVTPGEFL